MSFYLTDHAGGRLQQRGARRSDVGVVLEHGTPMRDAVVLTAKDVEVAVAECKRRIAQLERLRGMAVITREASVVTLYRPTAEQLRRLGCGVRKVRRK